MRRDRLDDLRTITSYANLFEMSYNSMYHNLQGYISSQLLLKHGGKDLLLLKRNNGGSCLYWPAQDGHSEVVRVLEEACKEYGLSRSDI